MNGMGGSKAKNDPRFANNTYAKRRPPRICWLINAVPPAAHHQRIVKERSDAISLILWFRQVQSPIEAKKALYRLGLIWRRYSPSMNGYVSSLAATDHRHAARATRSSCQEGRKPKEAFLSIGSNAPPPCDCRAISVPTPLRRSYATGALAFA